MWVESCALELETLLHVAVWWFTVAQDTPAPGLRFMGLRYRNEWAAAAKASSSRIEPFLSTWQKAGYLVLAIVFRWAWARGRLALATVKTRLEQQRRMLTMTRGSARVDAEERIWAEESKWQTRALFAGEKIEKMFRVVTFGNLIAFTYDGKYRTIIDRLLGLRLVHLQRYSPRNIPFDFMNQQLVFDELTTFVQFVVPITRVLAKLPLCRWLFGGNKSADNKIRGAHTGDGKTEGAAWRCVVCGCPDPVMPHVGICGHGGCYVCLMNRLLEDPDCGCQQCGSALRQLRPWAAQRAPVL